MEESCRASDATQPSTEKMLILTSYLKSPWVDAVKEFRPPKLMESGRGCHDAVAGLEIMVILALQHLPRNRQNQADSP